MPTSQSPHLGRGHASRLISIIGVTIITTVLTMLSGCAHTSSAPGVAADAPRWVEVNQVSLRYQLSGNGPKTLVLIHEMQMSMESWDDLLPVLQPGHRILRYDLRGFGMSEKIRGSLTIEDEAADLRNLLDALNITQPVTLIGGAVGGAIALQFAALHPERVRGL